MAAPETLACWTATTEDEQNYWIYVAAGGSEVSLACFAAGTGDSQRWLIYNAILNGGGGGGTPIQEVTAPTGFSDFSMFPGGVIPATGSYLALDDNFIWTLNALVDTTWQQSPRAN